MSIMMDWQAEGNRAKELDDDLTGRPRNSLMVKHGTIKLKISNPELLLVDQDLSTSQGLIFVENPLGSVTIGCVGRGY